MEARVGSYAAQALPDSARLALASFIRARKARRSRLLRAADCMDFAEE